jgi:hypothetical protein
LHAIATPRGAFCRKTMVATKIKWEQQPSPQRTIGSSPFALRQLVIKTLAHSKIMRLDIV